MSSDEVPPYVVRFVVLSLESPALINGARYVITWRRGSYRGTTPSFTCDSGSIDFSAMPEGHAIVHFKSNTSGYKGNARYQTKYITLSVEEASTKAKNQIGLVEFDVANCLQAHERVARVTKQADFRMGGFGATVTLQVVLHPQGESPPPNNVMPTAISARPSNTAAGASVIAPIAATTTATTRNQQSSAGKRKKILNRDEAMTLLLSVEALLEQRGGSAAAQHENERQNEATLTAEVQQLEERVAAMKMKLNAKRMISEAAMRAVRAETFDYVEAQFERLEQAESSKVFLRDVESNLLHYYQGAAPSLTSNTTELEQKLRSETQELAVLQKQQDRLGQLQLQKDVSDDLVTNLQRVHEKEQRIAMISNQLKAAATTAASTADAGSWEAQRKSFLEELEAINSKTKSLHDFAEEGRRMLAGRVEDWANRRYAPMRENDRALREAKVRDEAEQKAKKQHDLQKQIVDLFGALEAEPVQVNPTQPPAPAETVTQPEAASVDALYASVPKSADFETAQTTAASTQPQHKSDTQNRPIQEVLAEEYAFGSGPDVSATKAIPQAPHRDPFADLGRDMFAQITQSEIPANRKVTADPSPPTAAASVPDASDFASDIPVQQEVTVAAPVTATHSELRRTYAFGVEDATPAPQTFSRTTYDFGHAGSAAEGSTSRSSSQQAANPALAAPSDYAFGAVPSATIAPPATSYDFGAPSTAADGWATGFEGSSAATVSAPVVSVTVRGFGEQDSFFDSPTYDTNQPSEPAATVGMYSFEPNATSNTNSSEYRTTNIFASFE